DPAGQGTTRETKSRRHREDDPRIVVPASAGSAGDQADRLKPGLQNPPPPAQATLPDIPVDSLPWPGQQQKGPPAWMLEDESPAAVPAAKPSPQSAYEQEWNTLRPQVQNPWHTLDEQDQKMLIGQLDDYHKAKLN